MTSAAFSYQIFVSVNKYPIKILISLLHIISVLYQYSSNLKRTVLSRSEKRGELAIPNEECTAEPSLLQLVKWTIMMIYWQLKPGRFRRNVTTFANVMSN